MKDYFHFTNRERQGISVLLLICITFLCLPYLLSFTTQSPPIDFTKLQTAITQLKATQDSLEKITNHDTSQLKVFNPNTADTTQLLALGLSKKTVNTIINYRTKGGHFYQASDLKKIYTLSEREYERIAPYIQIQNKKPQKTYTFQSSKKEVILFDFDPNQATQKELIQLGIPPKIAARIEKYRTKGGQFYTKTDLKKIYGFRQIDYQRLENYIQLPSTYHAKEIDINQASLQDWQTLRGIGPSISNRIVKFREKLGGFSSIEQVAQTYGLPDSTFQKIKPSLILSPIFQKLHINKLKKEELQAHPYINWKQAKMLVNFRREHGPFKSEEEILQSKAFQKQEDWEKIRPYLVYD